MPKGTVAVAGSATIDRIVQGRQSACKRGGVVTYAGLTFCSMGIDTWVVTNVAWQDQWILQALEERGIHLLGGQSQKTTKFVNHVEGDERWQELPERADPLRVEQVSEVFERVQHLHLGPLHPEDLAPAALRWLAERKGQRVSVSLDLQGYVRQVEKGRVVRRVSRNLQEALKGAHMVKATHEELDMVLAFCGLDLGELMRTLRIEEMVVTQGTRGGWVCDARGEKVPYQARPVASPVDPTGAGDVFFAAYLVHRLHRNQGIAQALGGAAELAARQVEGKFIGEEVLGLDEADLGRTTG